MVISNIPSSSCGNFGPFFPPPKQKYKSAWLFHLKWGKGNEYDFFLQSAHMLGFFSLCHAYVCFGSVLCMFWTRKGCRGVYKILLGMSFAQFIIHPGFGPQLNAWESMSSRQSMQLLPSIPSYVTVHQRRTTIVELSEELITRTSPRDRKIWYASC
jgi:hypothetical protein